MEHLHYITAATGCHGNAHEHYHTVWVCVCVCNITCVFARVLNVYRHRIPTGLKKKTLKSFWIWRKKISKCITKYIYPVFWYQFMRKSLVRSVLWEHVYKTFFFFFAVVYFMICWKLCLKCCSLLKQQNWTLQHLDSVFVVFSLGRKALSSTSPLPVACTLSLCSQSILQPRYPFNLRMCHLSRILSGNRSFSSCIIMVSSTFILSTLHFCPILKQWQPHVKFNHSVCRPSWISSPVAFRRSTGVRASSSRWKLIPHLHHA